MAEKRLSRFGIGPMITAPSAVYTAATLAAGYRWPGIFVLDWLPQSVRVIGGILTAMGVLLWLAGIAPVMRAYNRDQL